MISSLVFGGRCEGRPLGGRSDRDQKPNECFEPNAAVFKRRRGTRRRPDTQTSHEPPGLRLLPVTVIPQDFL